ncbi:MAG TPA: hypothetical protein VIW69_03205 [Candidatus Elarobacter sp.]
MRHAIFTGAGLVLFCSTLATPAQPSTVPLRATPHPSASKRPLAASALYSRRSIRLVRSYLRLKLLEMREADLERARKVVERKLGIRALLGETPPPNAR